MINEEYTGDRVSAFYDVNAMTFESMGFSEGVIKNHGSSWGYHYYLRDHLGSTRMVVTDGDELAGAYMYQPYGTIDEVVTAAVDQVREKFTGKEYDNEGEVNGVGGIDAYYFGARMYDPEIGIFISTDPQDVFWNSYSYCGGNPIILVDPDGENPILIGMAIGAGVGFVGGGLIGGQMDGSGWSWGGAFIGMGVGGAIGGLVGSNFMPPTYATNQQLMDIGAPLEGWLGGNTAAQNAAQAALPSATQPAITTGTLAADNADLIYQYLTLNKNGFGFTAPHYFQPLSVAGGVITHTFNALNIYGFNADSYYRNYMNSVMRPYSEDYGIGMMKDMTGLASNTLGYIPPLTVPLRVVNGAFTVADWGVTRIKTGSWDIGKMANDAAGYSLGFIPVGGNVASQGFSEVSKRIPTKKAK